MSVDTGRIECNNLFDIEHIDSFVSSFNVTENFQQENIYSESRVKPQRKMKQLGENGADIRWVGGMHLR